MPKTSVTLEEFGKMWASKFDIAMRIELIKKAKKLPKSDIEIQELARHDHPAAWEMQQLYKAFVKMPERWSSAPTLVEFESMWGEFDRNLRRRLASACGFRKGTQDAISDMACEYLPGDWVRRLHAAYKSAYIADTL